MENFILWEIFDTHVNSKVNNYFLFIFNYEGNAILIVCLKYLIIYKHRWTYYVLRQKMSPHGRFSFSLSVWYERVVSSFSSKSLSCIFLLSLYSRTLCISSPVEYLGIFLIFVNFQINLDIFPKATKIWYTYSKWQLSWYAPFHNKYYYKNISNIIIKVVPPLYGTFLYNKKELWTFKITTIISPYKYNF